MTSAFRARVDLRRFLAVLAVPAALAGCGGVPSETDESRSAAWGQVSAAEVGDVHPVVGEASGQPAGAASSQPVSGEALGLKIEPEIHGGYARGLFEHWTDEDGDGCDTRQEVLARDSLTAPDWHPHRLCRVAAGEWLSEYDGVTVDDPALLHIDHIVPLAEAWESGARSWPESRRRLFANDLAGLVAVTSSANLSKGASDPAGWVPPAASARCDYAAVWVDLKQRWGLSADPDEAAALVDLLRSCG